jgi:hypothetical protein
VQQRGDVRSVVAVDRRRRAPGRQVVEGHGPAVEVGPTGELGQPIDERQRPVAQRAAERGGQVGRGGPRAELDEQVGDRRARQAGLQQPDEEDDRREPEHEERDAPDPLEHSLALVEPGRARQEQDRDHHEDDREGVDQDRHRGAQRPVGTAPAHEQDRDPGQRTRAQDHELHAQQRVRGLGL